jgi:large-conductance mechanosensitive channel
MAFAIFMVVKLINRLKRKEEAADTPPPPTVNKSIVGRNKGSTEKTIRGLVSKFVQNGSLNLIG